MTLGYSSKNFLSNLNNIFLFLNLRKTKYIKNWFLYLYWSSLLHELSKNTKLYHLFNKKKSFRKYALNPKYNLYTKFVKFNLELKRFKLKNYYKYKILLLKATISYFFDFLIKYIKTKKLNEDKFFLLKKLHFWKINRSNKFFTGFNYYKLLVNKKKNLKRIKLGSVYELEKKNESKILKIKLNLFSLSTYNLKWHNILFICGLYKSFYPINTLLDVMNLLDRKIDYLLINWFNVSSTEVDLLISDKLIKLNSTYLVDTNYIVENGFIITINDSNKNYDNHLLILEKKIFDIFLFLNENYNKFFNYLNWFLFIKFKKMYITNLLNVKNLIQNNGFLSSKHKNIFKYINYFYNIVKNYASILKKNMDLILSKKSLKSKKIFHIKANFFITVFDSNIQQPIGNDVSISTTTKFYTKAINHILTLSSFYYILKIKIIKLRALKRNNSLINIINSINFKKEIIRYFKDVKLNILLLTNLNIIFKNIININHHYLLYFIKNLLIKNVSLDINFLHTKLDSTYKIIKNEFTNNIIEFNDKNLIFSKSKKKLVHKYKYFKTNSKNIFLSNNVKKNYIHFYKYKLINNLLFNYINNNNIISYKSKIIFFNLNKSNSFLNMKSKWLQLFDLNEKTNFNSLTKRRN